MEKIAVISGRHPTTQFSSPTNHRIYCDHHGLKYIHCNWPTPAPNPYLNKLYYINEYIDCFDYIFWIDDDAFFLDLKKDLRTILPDKNHFLSICKSPSYKPLKTYFSSGQFALKCNNIGKAFLRNAMSTELKAVRSWWRDELGFFSNGDQDILTYLAHLDDYQEGIATYDYKAFNSRFENLHNCDPHEIFILHFTGKRKRKWKHYRQAAHTLQTGPSLLSSASTNCYPFVKIGWAAKIRRMLEIARS